MTHDHPDLIVCGLDRITTVRRHHEPDHTVRVRARSEDGTTELTWTTANAPALGSMVRVKTTPIKAHHLEAVPR